MKVNSQNIVTVIQARRGSSRLPGKVLLPLAGKPLLVRMAERVKASRLAGRIIIAATTEPEDDLIEDLCAENNLECFRGHPSDLLDRHFKAAVKYGADVVVKIPSDCPLIDPNVIDRVLEFYITNSESFDFVSNLHPATYPDGNDVEVMSIGILETAWKSAGTLFEREHTTPFIWERPGRFRIGNVEWETGKDYSMSHRFTIDYMEDYEFIKRVYDELYSRGSVFSLNDILHLLEKEPGIMEINEKYAGVNWYRNHINELKTITKEQTRFINE